MATNSHTHIKNHQRKQAIDSEHRNREIYEARLKGIPHHEIAKMFKLTSARVSQIISAVLDEQKEYNKELAKRLVDMEMDRLDKLAFALHSKAMVDGDPRATDSYLRIMERRAKMVGLDLAKENTSDPYIKVYVGAGPDDWDKVSVKEGD